MYWKIKSMKLNQTLTNDINTVWDDLKNDINNLRKDKTQTELNKIN